MKWLLVLPLLFCTACAVPKSQSYIEGTSAPQIQREDARQVLVTSDNTKLPVRAWLPRGKPKAVVVALHGFNDYSHAFQMPGEYLRQRGIAVYAYDQRGFGRAPSSGIWAGEENLTHDAVDMLRAVRERYPDVPLYLLGESMGGAVAIAASTRPDFPQVDGLILSAPAIWGGDTLNPLFRMTLWTIAHTVPQKVLTGKDLHILASDNLDMLRALGGDPYVIKETRTDAVYGLVQLMDSGYNDIGRVKLPTLILYGAHDQVIPPTPIVRGLLKANPETRAAYYPLGYHMLLRDLHGDVPLRDIIAWINDHQSVLPSGYGVHLKKKAPKKQSASNVWMQQHPSYRPYL